MPKKEKNTMEVYKIRITLTMERIQQTIGDKAFVESLAAANLKEVTKLLNDLPYGWDSTARATVSHLQESGG